MIPKGNDKSALVLDKLVIKWISIVVGVHNWVNPREPARIIGSGTWFCNAKKN